MTGVVNLYHPGGKASSSLSKDKESISKKQVDAVLSLVRGRIYSFENKGFIPVDVLMLIENQSLQSLFRVTFERKVLDVYKIICNIIWFVLQTYLSLLHELQKKNIMEKKLNEQESMQLINEMIRQTRSNIQKGGGEGLLVVGYAMVVISLLQVVLMHVLTPAWMASYVWLLMIPVTFVVFYLGYRQGKKALVKTHLDRIASGVWMGFVITIAIMLSLMFMHGIKTNGSYMGWMVTPLIMALVGFAQYISSIVYKFKPMLAGAIVFWIGSVGALAYTCLTMEGSGQMVIYALAVIGGFIVPGHMMNRKAIDHV